MPSKSDFSNQFNKKSNFVKWYYQQFYVSLPPKYNITLYKYNNMCHPVKQLSTCRATSAAPTPSRSPAAASPSREKLSSNELNSPDGMGDYGQNNNLIINS